MSMYALPSGSSLYRQDGLSTASRYSLLCILNVCNDTYALLSLRSLYILAVDGHFEEVEGKNEKEGCSDPVETHHHEESLLVLAEMDSTLPDISKTLVVLLCLHQLVG